MDTYIFIYFDSIIPIEEFLQIQKLWNAFSIKPAQYTKHQI